VKEIVKSKKSTNKEERSVTKVCHFWFNTGFIDPLVENKFSKAVIDVANKDKKCKIFKSDFSIIPVFRAYDPKTEKDPEEKYNNWIKYSLAKEKEKKKTVVPIEGPDDLNDTEDSSLSLKQEEDGDAAFMKKTEEKAAAEKTNKEKSDKNDKPDKIDKPAKTDKADKNDKPEKNDKPDKNDKPEKGEKPENGENEETPGPERRKSVYKTDGYNLDLDLTESDTESVDCTEEDPEPPVLNGNGGNGGDGITINAVRSINSGAKNEKRKSKRDSREKEKKKK